MLHNPSYDFNDELIPLGRLDVGAARRSVAQRSHLNAPGAGSFYAVTFSCRATSSSTTSGMGPRSSTS